MKQEPPKLAPWVLERPQEAELTRLDKIMRVVLPVAFFLALAIAGGEVYQHLMAEVFGI